MSDHWDRMGSAPRGRIGAPATAPPRRCNQQRGGASYGRLRRFGNRIRAGGQTTMTDSIVTAERSEADYESLEAKLAVFSQQLTPGEASALALLIEHAKEHATEVSGFEFTEPDEDEVSG